MPRTVEGNVHPAAWLFRAARQARSFATLMMTRPLLSSAKDRLSETSAQRGIGSARHPTPAVSAVRPPVPSGRGDPLRSDDLTARIRNTLADVEHDFRQGRPGNPRPQAAVG